MSNNISSESFNQTFSHYTATVKDVTLHYVKGGTGEPLFLIHGAFQTWREWKQVMPALAKKYTVIAIDIRGLGDSSKPETGFDMRNVADDVYQLAKHLGYERIRVAGHDLGGGITYSLAAAHPEMVQSFAFLDMLIPGFGFEQAWVPQPNGQFLWFAAFNSVPGVVERFMQGREEMYLRTILGSFTSNPKAISEEDMLDYIRTYSLQGSLKSLGEYFRAMWTNFEHNKENAKNKVTMPALALGGQYSTGEMAAQSLSAVAANVQSVIIENTGHWVTDENPSAVTNALISFFESN